jgi:hypothetical protein
VLGLRWLSNVRVRTRSEDFSREYAMWWLLYLFLITCVPFTTMVVGRFVMFAPAIWLYAGNTLLIVAVAFRLLAVVARPFDFRSPSLRTAVPSGERATTCEIDAGRSGRSGCPLDQQLVATLTECHAELVQSAPGTRLPLEGG